MSTIRLTTPLGETTARSLRAGDRVLLSGVIWTGRDQAHKRLVALLDEGKELPCDLRDQVIYFVGPCPAMPGRPIGSAGPTTSGRMDAYSPRLMADCQLRGMIGKGKRTSEVLEAVREHKAVYFGATGGTAVLLADSVKSAERVAYDDLGPEAVLRLEVEDMPLVVLADCHGGNLYESGPEEARESFL